MFQNTKDLQRPELLIQEDRMPLLCPGPFKLSICIPLTFEHIDKDWYRMFCLVLIVNDSWIISTQVDALKEFKFIIGNVEGVCNNDTAQQIRSVLSSCRSDLPLPLSISPLRCCSFDETTYGNMNSDDGPVGIYVFKPYHHGDSRISIMVRDQHVGIQGSPNKALLIEMYRNWRSWAVRLCQGLIEPEECHDKVLNAEGPMNERIPPKGLGDLGELPSWKILQELNSQDL